jgi:hypothetical protein
LSGGKTDKTIFHLSLGFNLEVQRRNPKGCEKVAGGRSEAKTTGWGCCTSKLNLRMTNGKWFDSHGITLGTRGHVAPCIRTSANDMKRVFPSEIPFPLAIAPASPNNILAKE